MKAFCQPNINTLNKYTIQIKHVRDNVHNGTNVDAAHMNSLINFLVKLIQLKLKQLRVVWLSLTGN